MQQQIQNDHGNEFKFLKRHVNQFKHLQHWYLISFVWASVGDIDRYTEILSRLDGCRTDKQIAVVKFWIWKSVAKRI